MCVQISEPSAVSASVEYLETHTYYVDKRSPLYFYFLNLTTLDP